MVNPKDRQYPNLVKGRYFKNDTKPQPDQSSKGEQMSSILGEAREKICDTLVGLCAGQGNKVYTLIANQILSISDTTDIECYACAFDKKMLGLRPLRCDPCGTTGIIKHKWKIAVVLENGELPEVKEDYPFERLETQADMLNEKWVKEVRQ